MILIIPLTVWSCVGLLRDYGEQVFKYQNEVFSELIMIIFDLEEQNDPLVEKLYAYEEELNVVCYPIQNTAIIRMSGREITTEEGYDASVTMKDCYEKAIEVRRYLERKKLWKGLFSEDM